MKSIAPLLLIFCFGFFACQIDFLPFKQKETNLYELLSNKTNKLDTIINIEDEKIRLGKSKNSKSFAFYYKTDTSKSIENLASKHFKSIAKFLDFERNNLRIDSIQTINNQQLTAQIFYKNKAIEFAEIKAAKRKYLNSNYYISIKNLPNIKDLSFSKYHQKYYVKNDTQFVNNSNFIPRELKLYKWIIKYPKKEIESIAYKFATQRNNYNNTLDIFRIDFNKNFNPKKYDYIKEVKKIIGLRNDTDFIVLDTTAKHERYNIYHNHKLIVDAYIAVKKEGEFVKTIKTKYYDVNKVGIYNENLNVYVFSEKSSYIGLRHDGKNVVINDIPYLDKLFGNHLQFKEHNRKYCTNSNNISKAISKLYDIKIDSVNTSFLDSIKDNRKYIDRYRLDFFNDNKRIENFYLVAKDNYKKNQCFKYTNLVFNIKNLQGFDIQEDKYFPNTTYYYEVEDIKVKNAEIKISKIKSNFTFNLAFDISKNEILNAAFKKVETEKDLQKFKKIVANYTLNAFGYDESIYAKYDKEKRKFKIFKDSLVLDFFLLNPTSTFKNIKESKKIIVGGKFYDLENNVYYSSKYKRYCILPDTLDNVIYNSHPDVKEIRDGMIYFKNYFKDSTTDAIQNSVNVIAEIYQLKEKYEYDSTLVILDKRSIYGHQDETYKIYLLKDGKVILSPIIYLYSQNSTRGFMETFENGKYVQKWAWLNFIGYAKLEELPTSLNEKNELVYLPKDESVKGKSIKIVNPNKQVKSYSKNFYGYNFTLEFNPKYIYNKELDSLQTMNYALNYLKFDTNFYSLKYQKNLNKFYLYYKNNKIFNADWQLKLKEQKDKYNKKPVQDFPKLTGTMPEIDNYVIDTNILELETLEMKAGNLINLFMQNASNYRKNEWKEIENFEPTNEIYFDYEKAPRNKPWSKFYNAFIFRFKNNKRLKYYIILNANNGDILRNDFRF